MSWLADVVMSLLALGMLTLLGLGVAASARLGGRDAGTAARLGRTVVFALALWLVATAVLAATGVLAVWNALPPRWPLLPLTAFVTMLSFGQTPLAKALITSTPRPWPIAAQSFRIGVELVLFALHEVGRAPRQITFAGRNFDILVGLTAPLVAWLVARQRLSPRLVVVWNGLGLVILAHTIGTVATSTPGPLRLDWPGAPFTAVATWPVVWLPAFLAPLAVFFHIVSLRQTLGILRRSPRRSSSISA